MFRGIKSRWQHLLNKLFSTSQIDVNIYKMPKMGISQEMPTFSIEKGLEEVVGILAVKIAASTELLPHILCHKKAFAPC